MTVRPYYAALGIELPDRATPNVPVRCFAQPDAHNRGDRSPSCSVNLVSGAWNCHGCGAHGGAYDAALAAGHSPRSAMQLLVAHGLAEPHESDDRTPRRPPNPTVESTPTPKPADSTALAAAEHDVLVWMEMLDDDSRLIRQLVLRRGWGWRAIRDLNIGFDGARITIPIRGADGALRGLLRYDPFGRRDPKMLAVPGTRLGLIPHPARESSDRVVLVEGPPDMVAARSCGLPAIAIPGTSAWQPSWAKLLAGRQITIVMDSDTPGRRAAGEIATALRAASIETEIVDLWPDRNDGYDLTDRILERRRPRPAVSAARTIGSLLRPVPHRHPNTTRARAAEPRRHHDDPVP
jgi:Toprim domain-containing protein